MAKRWKKSVDEGKEGKSLRRSETSRLWKKRTEEVKKEEAGLCVWEETSKMRKLGMTRRKKRRPVCVERNEEEEVVVVVVVVRAAQWTRCLPVSRAGPVGPHTHSPRPTCAPLYTGAGNPWLFTLTLVSILQYLFK